MNTEFINNCRKAGLIYRAVNHKLRREILAHLKNHPGKSVTDLFVYFRLEQSVISQQLGILRKANLVSISRQGKFKMYSLNDSGISALIKANAELLSS